MSSFRIIGLFSRIKFLKVFTINEHGGHLVHVTCTIYINFLSNFPRRLTPNLALIGQVVSEKKTFENNGYKHVFSPMTGVDNPLWLFVFLQHNYSVNLVLYCRFPHEITL